MDDDTRHDVTERSNISTHADQHIDEDVPDPEEDELDDLDDMLDEFSAARIDKSHGAIESLENGRSENLPRPGDSDKAADEFSKQLQDQMAALMGSMDESPEMKREIEAMMKELGTAVDPVASSRPKSEDKDAQSAGGQPSNTEEPFQETIRKTMERIQASGEQVTATANSDDSDDILAQMFKDMQSGGLEGAGNEEGFNKMLMGMMEQLTNKEILYEPMKELHDKFPAWMTKNKANTERDDLQRYEQQQKLVTEIVGKFEQKGYSDTHASDREFIVDRMQQMQVAGSPPADLVGDMNAASNALSDIDSGCAQQ